MNTNIREYYEEYPVEITLNEKSGRWCISAENEGGHNGTDVDLVDVVEWVKANRPDLLE